MAVDIWFEKYRPKTIEDLILPERILAKIRRGPYQNFLLYGNPGNGKTSAAKVLIGDRASLFINCSSETGVEVVRTKITEFCSTASIMGKDSAKVVVLDELDGASEQMLKALRGTIEQFHKTSRFIATCNYFSKIPESIQSRMECISFDFDEIEVKELSKVYYKRIFNILKGEGIKIGKDALIKLVDQKLPDLRSIINTIQGYHAEGKKEITLEDVSRFSGIYKELFEFMFSEKDPVKNYKYLMSEYSNRVEDVINALGVDFIEYIRIEKPNHIKHIGEICYEVNKHSYEHRFVIDTSITMLALVFRIQKILST